jgi:hypothetical protein
MRPPWLVLVPAILLAGCGEKQLDAKQLKNDVEQAISIASEAELFARLDAGGDIRDRFRSAHLDAVNKKVSDLSKELAKSKPSAGLEQKLDLTQRAVTRLQADVAGLNNPSGDLQQEDLRRLVRELAAIEQGL